MFFPDGDGGSDVKIRSVITYNKGGEWFPLKAPLVDHRGNPTNCHPVCLHDFFFMIFMIKNYMR